MALEASGFGKLLVPGRGDRHKGHVRIARDHNIQCDVLTGGVQSSDAIPLHANVGKENILFDLGVVLEERPTEGQRAPAMKWRCASCCC